MVRSITKDTVLCMSLAGRPSNIGTRFHNLLYAALDLDFVYKAFTTTDLPAAIAGIRALGIAALRDAGFHTGAVVARNARTGAALADQYGHAWRAEVGSSRPQLLVNATPVGMSGGPAADALPVAPEVVDAAETIMDVVALPALTPLVRRARAQASS